MRPDEIRRIERILREYRVLRYEDPDAAVEINRAVNRLPVELHKAVILVYFAGLSRKAAADALHCAPYTVRRWCLKAIAHLPDLLRFSNKPRR